MVGDSLRADIERGLRETRKCIVVPSPNFVANEGWSHAKVNGMFSPDLVQAVARSNMPAYVGLRDLASSIGHPLQAEAERLDGLTRADHSIQIELENEVSKFRLAKLREGVGSPRPEPLGHQDLQLVPADKHGLVDLSMFDQRCGGLAIGDSVFEILPAIGARNSSYWAATIHRSSAGSRTGWPSPSAIAWPTAPSAPSQ